MSSAEQKCDGSVAWEQLRGAQATNIGWVHAPRTFWGGLPRERPDDPRPPQEQAKTLPTVLFPLLPRGPQLFNSCAARARGARVKSFPIAPNHFAALSNSAEIGWFNGLGSGESGPTSWSDTSLVTPTYGVHYMHQLPLCTLCCDQQAGSYPAFRDMTLTWSLQSACICC